MFSNGDAHLKNFSLLETPLGDYRLSPAYDLLNSHLHINDRDFALEDGLLPKKMAQGKLSHQFSVIAEQAGIPEKVFNEMMDLMVAQSDTVARFTFSSFLHKTTQRQYLQSYQGRLKQLEKK